LLANYFRVTPGQIKSIQVKLWTLLMQDILHVICLSVTRPTKRVNTREDFKNPEFSKSPTSGFYWAFL